MSMSTSIVGFIPDTDPTYRKHAAVLIACHEAGIKELPRETAEYFGGKYPDKSLLEEKLITNIPYEVSHERDGCDDLIVHVNQIPKGVSKIRFTNSY